MTSLLARVATKRDRAAQMVPGRRSAAVATIQRHPSRQTWQAELLRQSRKGHVDEYKQQLRISWIFEPGFSNRPKIPTFLQEASITVQAAKGYDVPVVIILGADLSDTETEGRPTSCGAATRAKVRLFVTGPATPASLATEAETVPSLLKELLRRRTQVWKSPTGSDGLDKTKLTGRVFPRRSLLLCEQSRYRGQ